MSDQWETSNYVMEPSRSGKTTLLKKHRDGHRYNIHSGYDPVKESRSWVQSLEPSQHANYVVFGLGLGYHLLELLDQASSTSQIILIENDSELVDLARQQPFLEKVFSNSSIHWVKNLEIHVWKQELEPLRFRFALNGFQVAAFSSIVDDRVTRFQEFLGEFNQWISDLKVNINTQAALSKKFYKNFANNLEGTKESRPLSDYKDCAKDQSAILISAGPSLDKNIGLIKGAQRNGTLILAVSTAIIPLTATGITPDYVFAIDPNEVSEKSFREENICEDTWLVYDPVIPPSIVNQFEGRSIVMDSNNALCDWIINEGNGWGSLGPSMSVAHTALKFARYIGCKPIILVGQDLSFDGQRQHCTDSLHMDPFEQSTEPDHTREQFEGTRFQASAPARLTANDLFGKPVATTQSLEAFRRVFESEVNNGSIIINATEGGVPIPGMTNRSLREVIHQLDTKESTIKNEIKNSAKIPEKDFLGMKNRLKTCLEDFKNLQSHIKNSSKTEISKTLQTFNDFLQRFMGEKDLFCVVQGYCYQEFLDRERDSYKIELLEKVEHKNSILEMFLARDREFTDKMVQALPQLIKLFDDITKHH